MQEIGLLDDAPSYAASTPTFFLKSLEGLFLMVKGFYCTHENDLGQSLWDPNAKENEYEQWGNLNIFFFERAETILNVICSHFQHKKKIYPYIYISA